MDHVVVRREIIEYGSIPIATWLSHIDSSAAVQNLLKQLIEAGEERGTRCLLDLPTLARCLDVPQQHAQILTDTLEAVADAAQPEVRRAAGEGEADAVDVHAVALFLFAQLYIRQAQRPDAMDVWPSALPNGNGEGCSPLAEPASPLRAAGGAASSPRASPHVPSVHFQQQKSNHLVRKELQAHLAAHTALVHGYADYLQRHAHVLLALASAAPPGGATVREGGGVGGQSVVSATEFDRLALLFRAPTLPPEEAPPPVEPGSPMDISPTPFPDETWRLSRYVPLFNAAAGELHAPAAALAEWLSHHVVDEQAPVEAMMVSSPQADRWKDLPPAGVVQGESVDIQGVCKSTVVRGEGDFPAGRLRVMDCHDSVVYALAPLHLVAITACSDCTIVIGAVRRMLRVERCERLQLVAAAVRVTIASCHDCVLYLGVNRPPLLIGDNRFLQMAPYNTQYERLPAHMAAAGVAAEPNLWASPVSLAGEHRRATPDSDGGAPVGAGPRGARGVVSLLPPDKLLPFMVPFQGGPGPMCGGAATGSGARMAADLGSFVGLGDAGGAGVGPLAPSPFRLPPAYEEAKERKVVAVADLRNAVKAAALDDTKKRELQSVIQGYFKDWLMLSGNMRQVYDLARMEREEASASSHSASQ